MPKTINDKTKIGVTNISKSFAYSTYDDSLITAAYLGNITLKIDGKFTRTSKEKWSFDGKLSAFNDKYDANTSTHRSDIAELSTRVLDKLGSIGDGKVFDIAFNGDIRVHFDQDDKTLEIYEYINDKVNQNQMPPAGWDFV